MKMLFRTTCNDLRRECLNNCIISLQSFNMITSPKESRRSVLRQARARSEPSPTHLSVLSLVSVGLPPATSETVKSSLITRSDYKHQLTMFLEERALKNGTKKLYKCIFFFCKNIFFSVIFISFILFKNNLNFFYDILEDAHIYITIFFVLFFFKHFSFLHLSLK